MKGKQLGGCICLLFIVLFITGCGTREFDGGKVRFQYEPDDWKISAKTNSTGLPVITAYTGGGDAVFAVEAYDSNAIRSEELFTMVKESDSSVGKVGKETFESASAGGAGVTSCLYECVVTSQGDSGAMTTTAGESKTPEDYMVWTQIKSFSESRYIATIAVYRRGDEKSYRQIRKMFSSLTTSYNQDVDAEIAQTPANLTARGSLLDTYVLVEHDSAYDQSSVKLSDMASASGVDTSMKPIDGFSLLYATQLCDYSGNVINVKTPKVDSNDGSSIYYNSHGVGFAAMCSQLYGDSLENMMDEAVAYERDKYTANEKDYQNFSSETPVRVGDGIYAMISVDRVNSNGSTYPYYQCYYLEKQGDNAVLFARIDMNSYNYDGQTNDILKELSDAYGLPLTDYGAKNSQLTVRGDRVREETYTYSGEGMEVTAMDGYTYLGTTKIKDTEDRDVDVFVPLASNTRNTGSYAIGTLLGVEVQANTVNIAEGETATAESVAKEQIDYDFTYYKDNVRDYANVSKLSTKKMDDGKRAIVAFSADELQDDGSSYKVFHVTMVNTIQDRLYSVITILMNYGDYSEKTNAMISELEKAYSVDLNAYKNKTDYS